MYIYKFNFFLILIPISRSILIIIYYKLHVYISYLSEFINELITLQLFAYDFELILFIFK